LKLTIEIRKAVLTPPSEKRLSESLLFLMSALDFLRSAHAQYAPKRAKHTRHAEAAKNPKTKTRHTRTKANSLTNPTET
jgi:hypothetical protein